MKLLKKEKRHIKKMAVQRRLKRRKRTRIRHTGRFAGARWVRLFAKLKDKKWALKHFVELNSVYMNYMIAYRNAMDNKIKLDIVSKVPYELALKIISYLKPKDICNAAQTCRLWRSICEDNRIWREKCKYFGLLSDPLALEVLTRKIKTNDWKNIFKNHVRILRNWRCRSEFPIIKQLKCHEDHVITCLQFNPKSNIIVSGSNDMTLKVWSAETGICLRTLRGHTGGVWCSQITPNDIVISGSTDRTLKVWDAHRGELLHTLYGHSSTVRCVALDGDYVVSGSRDTTLRLWNLQTGECKSAFFGHTAAVRCVEFKNDIIVSGAYDHIVRVWDAKSEYGLCKFKLEHHTNRIYCVQFDGTTIASGSLDATICIWDAATGTLRHQLRGHTSLTSKMQLKNNLLVSANADSFCKIWDVHTGKCLHTLGGNERHTSAITSVYFNNWNVITSGDDGTVKLWDLKTGEFIKNLIVLPSAAQGGVVWRIRASYTKLICAVGARTDMAEDTHLLVLDLDYF